MNNGLAPDPAAAVEVLGDRGDHRRELVLADAGEERKGEAFARQGLRRREGAARPVEPGPA